MKVEIKIDSNLKEPKIIIHTKEITEEISKISQIISENGTNSIIGFLDNKIYILEKKEIEKFYTEENKVFASTVNQKKYLIKLRMYELEEFFKNTSFIRTSNSEIVNFDQVRSLDLNIAGTFKLIFKSGNITYASRRNISKIKKYLNI